MEDKRLHQRLRLGAVLTAVMMCLSSSASSAEDDQNQHFRDTLLNNLAHVKSRVETGFGLVIGRRDGKLWIATAAHVVFKGDWQKFETLTPADQLVARLRDSNSYVTVVGDPLYGSNVVADLAFITIPARPSEIFVTALIAPDVVIGEEVWVGGVAGEFVYQNTNGRFARANKELSEYAVSNLNAHPASSGGIAVTRRGIIGIYVGSRCAGEGAVIPISTIREAARARNIPFDLIDSGISPRDNLRFCIINDGPERILLYLMANKRYDLDNTGCTTGPAQSYRVVSNTDYVECQPARIPVTPATAGDIHISCAPSPTGIWQSNQFGDLEIRPAVDGIISFRGLNRSPGGIIEGNLRGNSPNLFLQGVASNRQSVYGTLQIERRRITGTLNFVGTQSQQLPIELAR
jgi:hypothetical protein